MRTNLTGLLLCLPIAAPAIAADWTASSCAARKVGLAAKAVNCRLVTEAKAAKTMSAPAFDSCDQKFLASSLRLESDERASVCPTSGDGESVLDFVRASTAHLAATLKDVEAMSPCAALQAPASGQRVTYGRGDDGSSHLGATLQFTDNGDGTITDQVTGLMWEKKKWVNQAWYPATCNSVTDPYCADPHNVNTVYAWAAGYPGRASSYDGPVVTLFLEQLNNRCDRDVSVACASNADCNASGGACGFAGYRDWRLPNVNELAGIVDYGRSIPALDPLFHNAGCAAHCSDVRSTDCSCDSNTIHWSSSTGGSYPLHAWAVDTARGHVELANKTTGESVRAVRGGY
ncbi:MAG TPA: DUF1566 domain-containing protein [Candidatus Limnocylindrales bacterium]|nr:DUF1566 domain-containing protein [Candidatus Limnocylindrales bacterium]